MAIEFVTRGSCPVCQSLQQRVLCQFPYSDSKMVAFLAAFYHGRLPAKSLTGADYRVICCENCKFIYQDPILDDAAMQLLYDDWIDDERSLQKKRFASDGLFRQYATQVQALKHLLPGRPDQCRVLEFGMGWGYWSRMAQAHGLNVCGYELSQRRSAYAHQMGLQVIDSLTPALGSFDGIYANQVFEHLPDPLSILCDLRDRLSQTGVIYIRVPDGRRVATLLARRGWQPELDAIHPLEHINCFTRKTLIDLGARADLRPVNAPIRLNWGRLVGGLKREIADRYLSTHVFFKPV